MPSPRMNASEMPYASIEGNTVSCCRAVVVMSYSNACRAVGSYGHAAVNAISERMAGDTQHQSSHTAWSASMQHGQCSGSPTK